jgi:pimeloyl-ACP methyl ester carboxylesterase
VTAILVHGVPDTERVWQALLPRLGRPDAVTLRLPGFGAAAPDGFPATKEAYAGWLVERIAAQPGPVDLVGHDWGALLVLRAACLAPERVRSWVAGSGPLDPEYVWHRAARLWQTPEVGEQVMAELTPARLETALGAAAVPPADAREAAARLDDTMKQSILRLYRSAVHVGREWRADLARLRAPGLVLWGSEDPYASWTWGERLAKTTGARFVCLAGCSHWWPLERPDEVAAEIRAHWSGLPR